MLLSEGQMSDFKGAALMLPALPKAKELLADKGYDADWFRQALAKRKKGQADCEFERLLPGLRKVGAKVLMPIGGVTRDLLPEQWTVQS